MYDYLKEKPEIFTESGQENFLKIRDRAKELLKQAGAFTMIKAISCASGNSYKNIACVDRLKEIGEIREITN